MLEAMGRAARRGHHRRWKQRTECMPQSNDLSRSLAALGPAAGSFPVDFPEHRQASGWRRLLPWAFGLLTLYSSGIPALRWAARSAQVRHERTGHLAPRSLKRCGKAILLLQRPSHGRPPRSSLRGPAGWRSFPDCSVRRCADSPGRIAAQKSIAGHPVARFGDPVPLT
jgi:hypothetical protein